MIRDMCKELKEEFDDLLLGFDISGDYINLYENKNVKNLSLKLRYEDATNLLKLIKRSYTLPPTRTRSEWIGEINSWRKQ